MKKLLETNKVQEQVILSVGYNANLLMPKDVAMQMMLLLSRPDVYRVEDHYVAHTNIYYPGTTDMRLATMTGKFIPDVPITQSKDREAYWTWLKTKSGLVGDSYVPEPYSVFVASKEGEVTNENP